MRSAGASIRNITEFERDYPNARTILLEQNYRSTQTILSAANQVISKNPERRAKNLWTAQGSGQLIVGYVGDNEYEEAQFIGKEIDRLVDEAEVRFGDVAIFYRTNSASRAIEDVFVRTGMPYRIVGGVRFYERREIRDALAYLRAIANPDDEVSLRRILNTPKRGIGDRAEASVVVFAEQERIAFADALVRVERDAHVGNAFGQGGDGVQRVAQRSAGAGGHRGRAGRGAHGGTGPDRLPGRTGGLGGSAGLLPAGEPGPVGHRAAGECRVAAGWRRRGDRGRHRRSAGRPAGSRQRTAGRGAGADFAGRRRRLRFRTRPTVWSR